MLPSNPPRQLRRPEDRHGVTESEHPGDEGGADRHPHLDVEPSVAPPLAALRRVHGALRDAMGDAGIEAESDAPRLPLPRSKSSLHELRDRERDLRGELHPRQPRLPHPINPERPHRAALLIEAKKIDGSAVHVEEVRIDDPLQRGAGAGLSVLQRDPLAPLNGIQHEAQYAVVVLVRTPERRRDDAGCPLRAPRELRVQRVRDLLQS